MALDVDHFCLFDDQTSSSLRTLLPNDILTPLQPDPNLMDLSSRHIDSVSNAERLLLDLTIMKRGVIRRISDSESTSSDQVGCCLIVSMGWIMSAALSYFIDY